MIRPKPKPSTAGPRAMAMIMTAAFLLGAWAGLKALTVPAFASSRDVIREIDPLVFQRYAAPPPPEESAAPADEEPRPEDVVDEAVEVTSFDEEVGAAMEELDRLFAAEEEAPAAAPGGVGEGSGGGGDTPGIVEDVSDDRFEALFGPGDELGIGGAAARRVDRRGRDQEGVGLGITERPSEAVEEQPEEVEPSMPGPARDPVTETRRVETAESEVVIEEFDAESFDGSAADRLATWMRANDAPLPLGVRAHVNFQPSFLTAAVPISADGRAWELFLMFNESLRELHIVLVEGRRSIYMIDRGFQEESRSLREGTVRRIDGDIVAIDSRTASASSERAREFYNVFLSWWESVKDDVGGS